MDQPITKLFFTCAINLLLVSQTAQALENQKQTDAGQQRLSVTAIPPEIRARFSLDPFYQQCIVVEGMPIVASDKVHESAIIETAHVVTSMLKKRPDVLRKLAENRIRLSVMATEERTCDIPEHSDLEPVSYWNRRARGLGATRVRPSVSCAEENVLNLKGDPYNTESILIHEFAHAIHLMALADLDPNFQKKLDDCYASAIAGGLWEDKYAATNAAEYWAEGVQSWLDTNRQNDNLHNHVDTREELKEYDPALHALIKSAFIDESYRYVRSDSPKRTEPHLKNLNRDDLPTFRWEKDEE